MKATYDAIDELGSFGGAYGFAKVHEKMTVRKMGLFATTNKNGEGHIKIEVLVWRTDGTKQYKRLKTNIFCKESNWDFKNQQVKTKDPQAGSKNVAIESLYAKVNAHILARQTKAYIRVPAAELKQLDELFPDESRISKKTLIEYIDDYIMYRTGKGHKKSTVDTFRTLKTRLKAYEDQTKTKLYFESMNLIFSDNFSKYMENATTTSAGITKQRFTQGTIEKTYKYLITVLYYFYGRKAALKIELSDMFQDKTFKQGSKSENAPHPVSRLEFSALRNHKFTDANLEKTQRRFLFQCSTGIRFSDAFRITRANINNIDTPNECIVYYPQKTSYKEVKLKDNNKVVMPVSKLVKTILQSVDYDMSKLKIDNNNYNESIRAMFAELQSVYDSIEFDTYTSHDGRDTYITYALESGADVPTLLKMVGQSSYDIMQRYFKSSDEKKVEAMNKISEFN